MPLRLAFVGQSTFFRACTPDLDDDGTLTTFIEFRQGADPRPMRSALDAFAPDVVVVFRPEILPPGVLADLDAAIVGFLTEPIPRTSGGRPHPDLAKRRRDLEQMDPRNVDRIVSFDPFILPAADPVMPVWRSLPIPVADRLYRDVTPMQDLPRILFVGRSTPHRESFLGPAKREFDVLHVAFGAGADELESLLADHEVCLNLHNEPYPSFENRVCLHLAAGHLVVTEPLSPTHGLTPGLDHLVAATPQELVTILRELSSDPSRYEAVRVRGRLKADEYRASTVFTTLASDLLVDLAAFRSQRR